MEFPIAGVVVNPLLLAGIGFVIGTMAGFFGVGGGFLTGPLMFSLGVPMNFVVGTDLAYMTGKSIIAARRHRVLGHVDIKLGLLMIMGTVPGVEAGAQIIELLKKTGKVDIVVAVIYITLLVFISLFTARESLRALRLNRTETIDAGEVLDTDITKYRPKIKLLPMISLPGSGIESISLWLVLGVGFITGLLAGMLGVGGGFIRIPMLIYILGIPTHVAIGTDLFEIVFSAGYGTLTHALKGNVDVLMALVMQIGAAMGVQIGAVLTRFISGPLIRLFFSILPMIGAILVVFQLFNGAAGH